MELIKGGIMKFKFKNKKYIWKPTKWQKTLFMAAISGLFWVALYLGWIYEQTVTCGKPWLGGC